MTTPARPPVQPLKPKSRQEIRRILEKAREDAALAMTRTFETQAELQRWLGVTDELWTATQPDEAPAFETSFRIVRAS